MEDPSYTKLVQKQIEQYRHVENMHELPGIFHYWSNKYVRPKLNAVCGVDTVVEFYAEYFRRATLGQAGPHRFVSLGAGECSLEIQVAARLRARGITDFTLDCFELSPVLIERGLAGARQANVSDVVRISAVDLNRWDPAAGSYSGIMASHSLHHFVELEKIFASCHKSLKPTGVFATNDMIGRNGHMRWPEVLTWMESLWRFLPDRLRYNHQFKRLDPVFVNHDCSHESFEGVRAQDILPLLNRQFGFTHFLAYGGLIDLFVDRGLGHNFDPKDPKDTCLIDFIETLNATLLAQGLIKPTMMFAVMSPDRTVACRYDGVLSPAFSERNPSLVTL